MAARHPAAALADAATLYMQIQDGAESALERFAAGAGAGKFTRADAQALIDRIADLRRAASAAGWLDEREAADTAPGEVA